MSENKCSLCGGDVKGDIMAHVRTTQHQLALRDMLNSPLSAPDPSRLKGYKEGQPKRRKTDKEEEDDES